MDWQPFHTVPRDVRVYARFANGEVDLGTFGRDINGDCWFGADIDHDDLPTEWLAITAEDRTLAAALYRALNDVSDCVISSGHDLSSVLVDGHLDLVRVARRFLEIVGPNPEPPATAP